MATDQSPPRIKIILAVGLGTVMTLVLLKPILDSYYSDTLDDVRRAKLVSPVELEALHAEEARKLTTSPAIPIDQAMADLAQKGRLSMAVVTPAQSNDTGALVGWQHLHDGEPASSTTATTAAVSADGGTSTTESTDGGTATEATTGDAGLMQPGTDQDSGAPHATTTAATPTATATAATPTTTAATPAPTAVERDH